VIQKGEKYMKKVLLYFLAVMLIMAGSVAFASVALAAASNHSAITDYLEIYGYTLAPAIQDAMHSAFVPQAADCGDVWVSLDEILYDGRWLYTAASVTPKEPEKVLILPGSAQMDNLVSGSYREGQRDDNRTFLHAAVEDGKRLLCVYVYPKEYDKLSAYILDHFQMAGDVSILLSGACLIAENESVPITWMVQLYEVDLATGRYDFLEEYDYPITISPVQPLKEKTYKVSDEIGQPFDTVTLIQSALSVYVEPQWKDVEDQDLYRIALQDLEGNAVSPGAPPDTGTFKMDRLPDKLYILTQNHAADNWSTPSLLAADDLENE
jgi:hypothetical protein